MTRLELRRDQILAYRRAVQALDKRMPAGSDSLRRAAWAGLQDSMPRAALHSIHARVEHTEADALDNASLVQVWGPRFSAYVVAKGDEAPFTLGRMPDDGPARRRAEETADRIEAFLAGRTMTYGEAGRGLGQHPNSLRYGATTGRILIRWEGARQPTIRMVPVPTTDPLEARRELVRRYLHAFGPATPESCAEWAGVKTPHGRATFEGLADELTPVTTPLGDAWILSGDEASFRDKPLPAAPARLLPSGDTYFLLWGADRELLVPDASRRPRLWTSRVWPGAVLVDGEIVGTWRRTGGSISIQPWRRLSRLESDGVTAEAGGLPLPDLSGPISVRWDG